MPTPASAPQSSPVLHSRPVAYAVRADFFRPSPVRAVFDISMREGMISLAGGNPDLGVLPLDELGAVAGRLIAEHGLEVLQYGTGAGLEPLREAVCEVMSTAGIRAVPGDILITSGSQMGLELVTSLLCDPGDVVLVEAPTYVGAIGTFQGLEADIVHVACDDDGLIPAELERTIAEVRAQGRTIKLLYTIPNFNNPSGITLHPDRRPVVAELCRNAGIALVEDDPYGLLDFWDTPLQAIRSFDESVIYLGSMSKIFSPGIRIGWVLAPRDVRDRLQLAAEATTICPSVLSQHLANIYLREFDWRGYMNRAIDRYHERAQRLDAALAAHLPESVRWTRPHGGFFVWLTLPEGLSAEALLPRGIEEGVVFVPGTAFFGDGSGDGNLRLSFSLESPDRIEEGVRRLARVVTAALEI
ncbi:PLP-dependent aminotransferase family protein [Microbacterium sp.]|uniref:aminotransferase-like domain-containing protein n=1 Tax=Microbacterium sp. TaxID=51671 RepID=UPI0039E47FF9